MKFPFQFGYEIAAVAFGYPLAKTLKGTQLTALEGLGVAQHRSQAIRMNGKQVTLEYRIPRRAAGQDFFAVQRHPFRAEQMTSRPVVGHELQGRREGRAELLPAPLHFGFVQRPEPAEQDERAVVQQFSE
jgi:hypothetical protein